MLEYQGKTSANDNIPGARIPDMVVDGDLFDKPGYLFRKLAPGDLKGLFLGEFTHCCQHMAGQGAACTRHGFLSENGGFYVVEKKETGEIVGQSWAWRGEDGAMVLDSLESLKGHFNEQSWTRLLQEMAGRIANQNDSVPDDATRNDATQNDATQNDATQNDATQNGAGRNDRVTALKVGTGGSTPALDFQKAADPSKPVDYNGYRDSNAQYVIWEAAP